ncbi:hypothetical protein [Bradyrhizobium cosmicum]|uniref:hypothetical protein n=1 Tax=Bradyrhizobium cosmicum TaxID=1404864 RepID=UPI0028EAD852|nr:hypothetical protein [Bradyrhizobium cosmicum]
MSKSTDGIAGITKELVGEILGDGRLAAEGAHQRNQRADQTTTSPPDQGITRAGRGEEQPKDKERAQSAKTPPGHMPPQPIQEDGEDGKR